MKTIFNEIIEKENQFRAMVRKNFPDGQPTVKVGDRVNTIHGTGIVVCISKICNNSYPIVEHDNPPINIFGNPFDSTLLMCRHYEYEPLKERVNDYGINNCNQLLT